MKEPCFACGHNAVTVAPRYQSCGACGFYWTPTILRPCDSGQPPGNPVVSKPLRLVNAWKLTGRARAPLQNLSARR